MKKTFASFAFALACVGVAFAQSSPGLYTGQVPSAAQWNSYFAKKQDVLGYAPVNRAGDTMQGRLTFWPPTTSDAGINLNCGTAPLSPKDGDFWCTSTGLYSRINGVTYGPYVDAEHAVMSSLVVPLISPPSDSTTALQIKNAARTNTILDVDSTNRRIGINKTPGAFDLDVNGAANFGGAITLGAPSNLGTPSSLTLTNAAGLPVAGISGLATGMGTFLGTPSSANLRATLTDESGTGAALFQNGNIGTATGTSLSVTGSLSAGTAGVLIGSSGGGTTTITSQGASPVALKTGTTAGTFAAAATTPLQIDATTGVVSCPSCATTVPGFAATSSPVNPVGTTSNVGVMMGLGGTCTMTPARSTKVLVSFTGYASNSTYGGGTATGIRYGTGAAPNNGVALTGTSIGNSVLTQISQVSALEAFSNTVAITGLTVGTTYWVDLALANLGGSTLATIGSITCTMFEQ